MIYDKRIFTKNDLFRNLKKICMLFAALAVFAWGAPYGSATTYDGPTGWKTEANGYTHRIGTPPAEAINPAEAAIGGVVVGSSEDYVRGIYGEPDKIEYLGDTPFGYAKRWKYGKTFTVSFSGGGYVFDVTTTGNNGLKTPAGFTVGSDIADLIDYFGQTSVYQTEKDFHRVYKLFYGDSCGMNIQTHKGKITKISCYENP